MVKSSENLLAEAECLYDLRQVEAALDQIARHIATDLKDTCPVVIGVMNGALVTLGYLLPRLPFVLEIDYVHATRYQGQQHARELIWKRKPEVVLEGRTVLLVDDILDQGITLAAIAEYCYEAGAAKVLIAVLGIKRLINFTPAIQADYIALEIPDRYVFGFGMDYENFWRNAPGIFASR